MHASVRSADLKDPGPPIPRTMPATRATGRGRGSGRDRSRSGSAGRGGMQHCGTVVSSGYAAPPPKRLMVRPASPPPAVPATAPSKIVGQLQTIAAAAQIEAAAAAAKRAVSADYKEDNARAELDRSLEAIHPMEAAAAEDAAEGEALRERIRAIAEAGVRRADRQRGGMLEGVCRCLN